MKALLAGYHSLNPHDPEGYYASLVSILTLFARQDAIIGTEACANACPFGPTRFELRQACEAAKRKRLDANTYDTRSQAQLAERDRLEREAKSESAETRRHTAEDFLKFLRDPQAQAEWARRRGLNRPESAASAPIDPGTGKHPPGTVLTNHRLWDALYGKPIAMDDPRHSRYGPSTKPSTSAQAQDEGRR